MVYVRNLVIQILMTTFSACVQMYKNILESIVFTVLGQTSTVCVRCWLDCKGFVLCAVLYQLSAIHPVPMVERVCPPTHVLVSQDGWDLHVVNVSRVWNCFSISGSFECVRCLASRIQIYTYIAAVISDRTSHLSTQRCKRIVIISSGWWFHKKWVIIIIMNTFSVYEYAYDNMLKSNL